MSQPIVIDYAVEFSALEEEMNVAQERATSAVLLAARTIDEGPAPMLPTSRCHREAITHLIEAVIELKAVNDGLVSGMMGMLKTVTENLNDEPKD